MWGLVAYKQFAYKKKRCSKSIPGFSTCRLSNAEDFFNVNIFFKCKYVRVNDYSSKYVCLLCCSKILSYCLTFSAMSNLNLADFTTSNQSSEIVILVHFEFTFELSDIDLWNMVLLDTHLDLLAPDKYTDNPSNYFVCLHNIFKTSSRHVFRTSSGNVFKTSSIHVFKTSSRHVSKTSPV